MTDYNAVTGNHRLVGWGDWPTMRESILPRVFGYLVQTAAPVVKEYHGDLYHDALWLGPWLDAALADSNYAEWRVCVRYSGTVMNGSAPIMFESLTYDAALYSFEVRVDERGEWTLSIDLLDSRPDRRDLKR